MENLPQQPRREFVLYTGSKGQKQINDAIKDEFMKPWYEALDKLLELEIIEECKRDNLKAMLDAEDSESVELAQELINIKCEEYGDRIQSPRSQLLLNGRGEHQLDIGDESSITIQNTLREGQDSFIMLKKPEIEMVRPNSFGDIGNMGWGSKPRHYARIMVPRSTGGGLDIP